MPPRHDDENRKVIHATICAPAADELRAFCIRHGVTVTAFLDGFGHGLSELEEITPGLIRILRLARSIDAARRSREPQPPPF